MGYFFGSMLCSHRTWDVKQDDKASRFYYWEDGKLYYKADAMKSCGLLKMEEEDGTEFLVQRKLNCRKKTCS